MKMGRSTTYFEHMHTKSLSDPQGRRRFAYTCRACKQERQLEVIVHGVRRERRSDK